MKYFLTTEVPWRLYWYHASRQLLYFRIFTMVWHCDNFRCAKWFFLTYWKYYSPWNSSVYLIYVRDWWQKLNFEVKLFFFYMVVKARKYHCIVTNNIYHSNSSHLFRYVTFSKWLQLQKCLVYLRDIGYVLCLIVGRPAEHIRPWVNKRINSVMNDNERSGSNMIGYRFLFFWE